MEDEDGYDAQDKDGDDGLPWARDRETERRKVSERQRFMRRRRACAVGRSCLAFVASEPIDDRGREASDCGSRAVRGCMQNKRSVEVASLYDKLPMRLTTVGVGARNKASNDFRVERVSTHELIALESSPESCRSSSGLRLARGRSGRCRSSPQGRSPCGSS